jgi:hypothetical protein
MLPPFVAILQRQHGPGRFRFWVDAQVWKTAARNTPNCLIGCSLRFRLHLAGSFQQPSFVRQDSRLLAGKDIPRPTFRAGLVI